MPPHFKRQLNSIGFSYVKVTDKHPCICSEELYSFYNFDGKKSLDTYNDAKKLLIANNHIPLLLERELVFSQEFFEGKDDFDCSNKITKKLLNSLEKYTSFSENFSTTKQADIHLSIPIEYSQKGFFKKLNQLPN